MARTITVKGTGAIDAKADYITITLQLNTVRQTYQSTMQASDRRVQALQQAIAGIGFKKEDLKTIRFSIDTKTDRYKDPDGLIRSVMTGYEIDTKLTLSFDFEPARLAKTLAVISACGANPELSIAFTVKNPEAVKRALLSQVSRDAAAKAQALCCSAGGRLGNLMSIEYNWGEIVIRSNTSFEYPSACTSYIAESPSPAEFTPEDIHLSDTAVFVWEIK